jgi:hypothetical protein
MNIEVSAEMIRLLGILAHYPDGVTQHELVAQDVRSSLIYQAVMLNLVHAKQEPAFAQATYRFEILPAGMKLLGVYE